MEYACAGEAAAAAAALDGREVLGRRLAVMPSAAGAGASGVAPRHTLYVSNLPYDATAEEIKVSRGRGAHWVCSKGAPGRVCRLGNRRYEPHRGCSSAKG